MANEFRKVKKAVLAHVQTLFEEMEESMAMSHQEKYALLEDACENATDKDELRVALEQWYAEHSEDLQLDRDIDEIWEGAIGLMEEESEENGDDDLESEDIEDEEEDESSVNYNDEYEK